MRPVHPLRYLLAAMLVAAAGAAAETGEARLLSFWPAWVERTGPLMSAEERLFFRALTDDRQRELFASAFWRSRGDSALERWRRNFDASRRLRARSPWATRLVQWSGQPARIETWERCPPLRRLEVWEWQPWNLRLQGFPEEAFRDPLLLVLVERTGRDPRSLEPWRPGDLAALGHGWGDEGEPDRLPSAPQLGRCFDPGRLQRLQRALARAVPLERLEDASPWPRPDPGWLERLRGELDSEIGAGRGGATVELSYPGSFAERYTIVRGHLQLDPRRLSKIAPGRLLDRVTVIGDIYRGTRLADSFEIVHHLAGAVPGPRVGIDLYRRLRPGPYLLRLRVADRFDLALLRENLRIDVPRRQTPAAEPAGSAGGFSRLTRAEGVVLDTLPTIELPPPAFVDTGSARLHAVTAGGPVAAVVFDGDRGPITADHEPPFEAEIEVPPAGLWVTASAVDGSGRTLATARRRLERPEPRFTARFRRPLPSRGEAPLIVTLPAGQTLARLECLHDSRRVKTLTAPPFACPLPTAGTAAYLAATATLTGGESVDDVVLLGPGRTEEMEVRLIELYASIVDPLNRPARSLGPNDFRLVEGGAPRPLVRVESLADLPLNIAVLLDLSASMGRRLRLATAGARAFFERVVGDDDRACLLGFHHDLDRVVPFTGEVARLREGLTGLRAWGSTRLYDAIAWALFQFAGLENRRALVVLSDGADVGSDYPPGALEQEALRSAVAVYPIVLGTVDETTVSDLRRIAERSGGRLFRAASAERLETAYRQIEQELRSRYLLVFEPSQASGPVGEIRIEVLSPGYSVREVRGHFQ